MAKFVYSFAAGKAEGRSTMKDLLGGKGANLAEMTNLGIPVPPGFTISTRACNAYFEQRGKLPKELKGQVDRALKRLQSVRKQRFSDNENPLLVSVRSGAKFSMPGMMDTILNLGLNDEAVEGLARTSGDRRFAQDSYRRFIQMYADVVLEIPKAHFEDALAQLKKARRVKFDTELSDADLSQLVATYKKLVKKHAHVGFPQDPHDQLWGAITAVFRSWNNARAKLYRRKYGIPDSLGTAVNVQCMVFGNLGTDCGTGVAFTRNPATGNNELFGEYLINAQGEDVVAGIRTPQPISKLQAAGESGISMEERMPGPFKELMKIRKKLESHYRDMQDVEFTVERDKLYMLQTRNGKRTGLAALNIAFDLYTSRKINKREAVQRVDPEMLVQLLAPIFDAAELESARKSDRSLGKGLPAGPGAASGRLAFTAERAEKMAQSGHSVILVRNETSPEDLGGMVAAAGIVTSRGGMTSHAAVVARGMGKPCIVGAETMQVDEKRGVLLAGSNTLKEGDALSMDGSSGEVLLGSLTPFPSEIQQVLDRKGRKKAKSVLYDRFVRLLRWADSIGRLEVRANADTPFDSALARQFGAEGIGLCRTEHMFFAEERIDAVREMILADDLTQRKRALKKLLPMQRKDFAGIFKEMDGFPVTIRLLDPPLHEFLPNDEAQFRRLAKQVGTSVADLEATAESLREVNPMLGHRGCRLGITHPEVYEMQTQAIFEAAANCAKKGIRVFPEVMIPLVGTEREFQDLEARIRAVATRALEKKSVQMRYSVGTMIEVPRAALIADRIATHAEFFSFGTNDLTQMTYGFSRDDVAKFLPYYIEQQILPGDPFESLDREGVGRLVRLAIREGRDARPKLKIGVCGEHGGDPRSVSFFHEVGADYVSCSPFRVPVARLAAAHAVLAEDESRSGTD